MIKILVSSPIKADATSYYRAWGALNHLSRHHDVQLIDINTPENEISWAVIQRGDILFCQRPSTQFEVKVMETARNCNVPIWIDYDDDYFNIPETNPRHELYGHPHRVEQIKRAIDYADIITVSTICLKEAIIKATGKAKESIQVIPNGVDEDMFDVTMPEEFGERDVILWRGGDTHDADINPYLDVMVKLYNEFPEYTWAFIGYVPEKMLKLIDNSRIKLWQWDDVMVYFDRICDIQPKITIVPWEKNTFNDSKSNCSFLESTVAGSVTVFPQWSSEFVPGMVGYNSVDDFYNKIKNLLINPSEIYLKASFETLQRFTLKELNKVRYSIASDLKNKPKARFGFRNPKYQIPITPASDEEFYRYTHEHLYTQDNETYWKEHSRVADELVARFKPKSIVEIGCGPGGMIERFMDLKIPVKGFDTNPHFKEYFDKRNPYYKEHFVLTDFSEVQLDGVFDLCVSIEVFEHIPPNVVDEMIEKLSHHFKHFYFTSTPYHTSKKFDGWWQHIGLRTHDKWVKDFESRGWKYEGNPKLIAVWDAIFSSTNVK